MANGLTMCLGLNQAKVEELRGSSPCQRATLRWCGRPRPQAFLEDEMAYAVKCWICRERVDPRQCNGIYGEYGHRYYCQDEDCQERFIEDAGDPPGEPYE